MTKEQLKERFKQYAISVAFFVLKLPYNIVNRNYSDQLNRAASGAAANYRASLRAKLIGVINPSFEKQITPIYAEGNELLSIIVASLNTLRNKQTNRKS